MFPFHHRHYHFHNNHTPSLSLHIQQSCSLIKQRLANAALTFKLFKAQLCKECRELFCVIYKGFCIQNDKASKHLRISSVAGAFDSGNLTLIGRTTVKHVVVVNCFFVSDLFWKFKLSCLGSNKSHGVHCWKEAYSAHFLRVAGISLCTSVVALILGVKSQRGSFLKLRTYKFRGRYCLVASVSL